MGARPAGKTQPALFIPSLTDRSIPPDFCPTAQNNGNYYRGAKNLQKLWSMPEKSVHTQLPTARLRVYSRYVRQAPRKKREPIRYRPFGPTR